MAFSETSQSGYSLLAAIERGTEGVSYIHVWYGVEKGDPKKIGKEIAAQTDQVGKKCKIKYKDSLSNGCS